MQVRHSLLFTDAVSFSVLKTIRIRIVFDYCQKHREHLSAIFSYGYQSLPALLDFFHDFSCHPQNPLFPLKIKELFNLGLYSALTLSSYTRMWLWTPLLFSHAPYSVPAFNYSTIEIKLMAGTLMIPSIVEKFLHASC